MVGQTQFTQSLEEGYTYGLSFDEAAVVVAAAHEILEALKASKKRKLKKSKVKETKEPTITAKTGNGDNDKERARA